MSHCSYCACVRASVFACVRACVRVCVRALVCACLETSFSVQVGSGLIKFTPMTKGANHGLCDAQSPSNFRGKVIKLGDAGFNEASIFDLSTTFRNSCPPSQLEFKLQNHQAQSGGVFCVLINSHILV